MEKKKKRKKRKREKKEKREKEKRKKRRSIKMKTKIKCRWLTKSKKMKTMGVEETIERLRQIEFSFNYFIEY